jgi:hypothetical protein
MAESTNYRSVADADAYFADQLYATDWTGASDSDKLKALIMATRAVDSLKYDGVKRSLWEAMSDDGGDTTTTSNEMLAETELTELEIEAANALQIKQFPRDDSREAEAWTLTIDATGGTFDLILNSETAATIAFDATSATIQTALEGLASVSPGDVTVTGDGPHTITLGGDFATVWNNTLTSDATNLTGGGTSATVETAEDNVPDEIFYAVCEEAKSLLSGRDAEQEFRNLELNSDGVGSNRVTMDRSGVWPEHSAHLITSPLAWKYVQRFLAKNNTFKINRR